MIRLKERLINLIYPRRCPMCDLILGKEEKYICTACAAQVEFVRGAYCMKCGKPVLEEQEYCRDCLVRPHRFDCGRVLFVYEGALKKLIYRFKYAGRKEYAESYAYFAQQELGGFVRRIEPDALVPVPLHRRRFCKRGYNQAELFAVALGKRMGIPVERKLVQRTRNTLPQKELDSSARQNNLKKAFKLCGNDVKLNTIIIIDDIYTTGSTIDAVAEQFRRAGVQKIYFLAISGGK